MNGMTPEQTEIDQFSAALLQDCWNHNGELNSTCAILLAAILAALLAKSEMSYKVLVKSNHHSQIIIYFFSFSDIFTSLTDRT